MGGWHQTEAARKQISETMKQKIASGEIILIDSGEFVEIGEATWSDKIEKMNSFVSAGNVLYHFIDSFELCEKKKWH